MADLSNILDQMRNEPANVRFNDLKKVCESFFGKPRQHGTSHAVFKTPWPGDPRVNIQEDKGKAKAYQVRQVLVAIEKLKDGKK
ncbi:MAG: toxin HicA [Betaproteobacteria bacterium]|nr:toxin HicA [Betaproteobacteria bacterium]